MRTWEETPVNGGKQLTAAIVSRYETTIFQYMAYPPEADIAWPVTHLLLSSARNATICAMSSGVPILFSIGVDFFCESTSSGGTPVSKWVGTGPGFTAFTVWPAGPSSAAQHLVKPSTAALEEQ